MDFTLNLIDNPFDLSITLESGQVFRWENKDGWWVGIVDGGVVKIRQEGFSLQCLSSNDEINQEFIRTYFRLDEDFKGVIATIMKDKVLTEAVQRFYGLRLIRQPIWECLISFVIATNSNIPRIKGMISNLCDKFGRKVSFHGLDYSLFPTPEALATADVDQIDQCGVGYRAGYVKSVAEAVHYGKVELSELLIGEYALARDTLIKRVLGRKALLGIGPKVADCILLFSCDKDEAFPIDIWISRAIAKYYRRIIGQELTRKLESRLGGKQNIGRATYDSISSKLRNYFGRNAGYAQQYLFLLSRTSLSD